MDQFDAAARQVVGGEFEQAASGVMDDQRTKLRASLYTGLMENPDQVARAQSLGKMAGLPRDVVQRNLPEVERSLRMQDVTSKLNETPTLAQWLSEQENAAIAHDNIENMGQIERKIRQFGGGAVEAVGMSLSGAGVLADVLQRTTINDFATIFLPEPKRGPMGLEPQKPTIESLAGPLIGAGARQAGGEVKSFARDDLMVPASQRTFSDQVAGGLGQVLGQIAMLPVTRGVGLYAQGADVMAEKVAPDIADQRTKDLAVLGGAAVTGLTEQWALDKLLGPMAVPIKNQVAASLARIGIASAAEGGQEFSENVLQDTIRKALTNRDAEIDIGQSIEEGGVGAVVGGIVRSVVESALHIRVRGERRAQKAEQDAQAVAEMNQMAAADKVLQRNPEAFEQFIKQAAEDGPVPVVYIDAKALMQSGVADQVANVSASVAEQIAEAVETGGQIAIPVEEYAARIAPTEYAQSLVDHLKTEPDGFSRVEAQQFMETQAEQLQQEVERRLSEQQADATFTQSQEVVKTRILEELNTVGRFTPEKNEADATLFASYYAVRAAQLGVTPEQFYDQRRVRFAAQSVAGQTFDQAGTVNAMPENQAPGPQGDAQQGADKGKRVAEVKERTAIRDEAGEPLRLYHGSERSFAEFDIEEDQRGVGGVWFTDSKNYAYDMSRGGWDSRKRGAGGQIVHAYLDVRNPYEFDVLAEGIKLADDVGVDRPTDSLQAQELLSGGSGWDSFVGDLVQDAKRAGHDALVIKNFNDARMVDSTAYVVFDQNAIAIERIETNDQSAPDTGGAYMQQARGAFSPESFTITLLKGADLSTALHEGAHFFFENDIALAAELVKENATFGADTQTEGQRQIIADVSTLLKWHGIDGTIEEQLATWYGMDFEQRRVAHERTAESFEKYLFEGRAPSLELAPYFQKFRAWMVSVYKSLKAFLTQNPEAGKLDDTVRQVFDRMLASSEQIKLAESSRSMFPLFANAEEAGMTVEEFAAYQAQSVQPTADAIEELQARGVRDLQWLRNARGREIKKLQKRAAVLRAQARIEARREIMSQPVYRAWQFLTGKLSTEERQAMKPEEQKSSKGLNPETDSLFVAIAKLGGLDRSAVEKAWGWDAKERTPQPAFGQPLLRRNDGLSIEAMAERLQENGYLAREDDYMAEFEAKFDAEYRGDPQYAIAYDYARSMERRAGDSLDLEAMNAGRLEMLALQDMGLPPTIPEFLEGLGMTAKNGIHPDLVADLFGFTSGDELVRTLAAAEKPKEAIEALTDRLMLERNGELATPEAIEQAADMAIHNAARARMVATEYNALAQATGQPKVLTEAAREYARNVVSRLLVRNIKPSQYANAAARASQNAQKAQKSGDMGTAAAEKRNQLVQTLAAREAHNAREEVDKGVDYLRKFEKASVRKGLDQDYIDQIDQMLERFDLKKSASLKEIDKRKSLAAWIESQREAGMEPDIPEKLENEAFTKSYKDLTVEEFRGLVDSVRQIEHLGRLKRKLLTAKDEREFRALADEAAANIRENGGEIRPVELEGEKYPWLKGMLAGHRKLASLFRQMDGGKDDGVMWNLLARSMNERSTQETVANEQATMKLAEIFKPVVDLKGGLNGDKRFIPEIGNSLTRGGRLSVALNWGNTQNRQRIMDGDGWTDAQVKAILRTLTPVEAKFVNDVWEYIDTFWPEVAAKEKRLLGKEPEKVQAEPFDMVLADGSVAQMRGGYYPLKYDADRSGRTDSQDAAQVAKDMIRGAFTRATTRRGHTKQRVENVRRPVRKNLDVITQHVSQVTHDLAWHEWLIDANRVLQDSAVENAIRDHYGPAVIRTIKDNIAAIATADVVPQTKMDQALLYLRSNISRSTMGWSLTTAFLQPFGLTQSMVRIGPKYVLRGMARWGGDLARFQDGTKWIYEKSDFMRLRDKTFNRELHEINGRINQGKSRAREIYDASLFMMMQKMQRIADVPTWIGAYEKAIEQGADDAKAVALADQAVLDSQGGGQTKDMAELQRKHPMLSMFYSYFNVTYNLAAESTAKTDFRNPQAVAGWMSDMLLLMIVPALGPAIVMELLKGGGDDDPEEWAKKLAEWQAGYLLGTMLGLRELSGVVAGFDYSGPPVGRVIGDIGKAGTQIAQGEADEALGLSIVRLFGSALGVPTVQIIRSWKGWQAWSEGDAPPTAVLLGPPPQD